jgi:hypothetical protein
MTHHEVTNVCRKRLSVCRRNPREFAGRKIERCLVHSRIGLRMLNRGPQHIKVDWPQVRERSRWLGLGQIWRGIDGSLASNAEPCLAQIQRAEDGQLKASRRPGLASFAYGIANICHFPYLDPCSPLMPNVQLQRIPIRVCGVAANSINSYPLAVATFLERRQLGRLLV